MTRTTRRSTVAGLVLTAGLMLVACASAARTGQGATLVRQLDDAGRTTVLHPGDHLLLDLGTGRVSAFLKFTLTGYPGSQLRLVSIDPAKGRFEFQAVATGSGDVRVEGNFR
jgi:hypothetical protein